MSNAVSTRRSRELRRVSTPAEQRLWACLRDRRLRGLKFRRQLPLHGYIVDFYCAEHRLVVELDGAAHQDREQQAYDEFRDALLRERGLMVLRFKNAEVEQRLEAVLGRMAAAAGLTPRPHPASPPTAGERGLIRAAGRGSGGIELWLGADGSVAAGAARVDRPLATGPSPRAVDVERGARRAG